MTEAEWLAGDSPKSLLEFLQDKVSDRKLRLFAIACCRAVPHLIEATEFWNALRAAESHTDGEVSPLEYGAAVSAAHRAVRKRIRIDRAVYDAARYPGGYHSSHAISIAAAVAGCIASEAAPNPSADAFSSWSDEEGRYVTVDIPPNMDRLKWNNTYREHQRSQVVILRDIIGNPFRPATADPRWLTPSVRALVEGVYTERAFDRLPVLADALEEAGCDNADILAHCRGGGPHVRGCWVVDLLAGRA